MYINFNSFSSFSSAVKCLRMRKPQKPCLSIFNELSPYLSKEDSSYGFVMSNGYSVNLFYRPSCKSWQTAAYITNSAMQAVCINIIYDMNGKTGPNQIGKDIGTVTVIDPVQPIAAGLNIYSVGGNATKTCSGGRMPTTEEATAYVFNMLLYSPSVSTSCRALTSTVDNGQQLHLYCNGAVHWGQSSSSLCIQN